MGGTVGAAALAGGYSGLRSGDGGMISGGNGNGNGGVGGIIMRRRNSLGDLKIPARHQVTWKLKKNLIFVSYARHIYHNKEDDVGESVSAAEYVEDDNEIYHHAGNPCHYHLQIRFVLEKRQGQCEVSKRSGIAHHFVVDVLGNAKLIATLSAGSFVTRLVRHCHLDQQNGQQTRMKSFLNFPTPRDIKNLDIRQGMSLEL
ncbi:hypothetical protein BDN72DRAFT_865225 [Pluteus cervinus]|uniref:Uncharacterized protein n=1 Tax=Pluteus cervinus TaxID=181527 RepID=A0ACD3A163_9AGAR|nr:hypothetical protein BDN72DRAFT_865225 [Pluteus cervinus]